MYFIYDTFLHRPLLNGLIFFYQTIAFHDIGFAIILLTIAIRIILFPVFQKSVRHQSVMQRLQPKLKKLQETHKNDKTKQAEAMMALYKDHNINPFSGILLVLVQFPVLIALYQIVRYNLTPESLSGLYSFIQRPITMSSTFLGLINLRESSMVGINIVIVVLAAAAQYYQGKLGLAARDQGSQELSPAEKMARRMVFIGPVLTIVIFSGLPAAVALYWLTTSAFSVFQQIIVNRELKSHGKLGDIHKENS